jgi:glycosyltransferase involved in cell wall biosynthesis
MELTILMPCLNEAATLKACILKAQSFLAKAQVEGEVLVSDNGSNDGSPALAEELGARVVHCSQRGYGAALLAGIHQARGRYIIMADADDSYDFASLDAFLDELRCGSALVMGNRFRGGIQKGAMPALHRYLGNPVLSFVGRLFFQTPIGDFHCGLRGFSREAILSLGLVTPGMEFASEMVAKASLAGLRISEVPTVLYPDGRNRPPHLRSWRDGWRHLKFLLLYCPRWLFLYPGLSALSVGILGFGLLASGPVYFHNIGLGVHSFLYMSALIVLGVQCVQMALLIQWMSGLFGIVPKSRWLLNIRPWISTERGLLAGLLVFMVGLVWSANLLFDWRRLGFGVLDPTLVMRSAIPAVTFMIVGIQIGVGSMFASALHFCWQSVARNQVDARK